LDDREAIGLHLAFPFAHLKSAPVVGKSLATANDQFGRFLNFTTAAVTAEFGFKLDGFPVE
jgi:hypothetical protein